MKALKGIVLRTTDCKERDKLLTVATFEEGIVTVTAKGVRSPTAKLKSYVNPFTFGEFTLTEGRAGYILNGVLVEDGFFAIWHSQEKYAAAVLMQELLEKSIREVPDISEELLLFLKTMNEIAYGATRPYACALWFMTKLAERIGVDYSKLEKNGRRTIACLNAFSLMEVDEIGTYEGSVAEILDAVRMLGYLYRTEIGVSLPVLNEIWKSAEEDC